METSAQEGRTADAGSRDSPLINSERRFRCERIGSLATIAGRDPADEEARGRLERADAIVAFVEVRLPPLADIPSRSAASIGSSADGRFEFRRRTRRGARRFTRFDSARRQHALVRF